MAQEWLNSLAHITVENTTSQELMICWWLDKEMDTVTWVQILDEAICISHGANHIIFTNPSAQAGYDTRSFFKRSLTVLSSEFSFS